VGRAQVRSLDDLRALLRELKGTSASHGRVGILQLERQGLRLDTTGIEEQLTDLPEVLRATVPRLRALEEGADPEVARAALYHLYRLVREVNAGEARPRLSVGVDGRYFITEATQLKDAGP
jgi:hypothetical protein